MSICFPYCIALSLICGHRFSSARKVAGLCFVEVGYMVGEIFNLGSGHGPCLYIYIYTATGAIKRRACVISFIYHSWTFYMTNFLSLSSKAVRRPLSWHAIQSPLFISMRRDWRPYAYRAFMFVRRVNLSHKNLVGTRTGMLVGGLCLYTVCL